MTLRRLLPLAALAASLTGCYANEPSPPTARGVCYSMVEPKKNQYKFNVLARNVADLEHCAASLEAMRVEFLSKGGNRYEVWGVYQGQYIYINSSGLYSSQFVHSPRYPLLVRTGDGRLARPGTVMTH